MPEWRYFLRGGVYAVFVSQFCNIVGDFLCPLLSGAEKAPVGDSGRGKRPVLRGRHGRAADRAFTHGGRRVCVRPVFKAQSGGTENGAFGSCGQRAEKGSEGGI